MGELSGGGKCPSQNGRGNCPGGLSYIPTPLLSTVKYMCTKLSTFIAGKNPTNLKAHIGRSHAEVHAVLNVKEKDQRIQSKRKADDIDSPSIQTLKACISRKITSYSINSADYVLRLDSITNFIIETGYPTAMVDHPSSKNMQQAFDVKFRPPCSATIAKSITARFIAGKEQVSKKIGNSRKVTICLDGWSKKRLSCSFLGISACFYDLSINKAIHVTLAVEKIQHPHTGKMLSDCLFATLTNWNISTDKILLIVTDNGANMVKAVKLLQERAVVEENVSRCENKGTEMDKEADNEEAAEEGEEDEEMEMSLPNEVPCRRMPCLAHSLQLVIKDVYKSEEYSPVLGKARHLVKTIKHSSVAMEKTGMRSGKTIISDCATRWNSTYQMLKRLILLKKVVTEVMSELNQDTLMASEWLKIDTLVELLEPFAVQTDILQTDASSLSNVIPSLLDLQCHLSQFQKSDVLTQMMLAKCNKRFETLLNPHCVDFNPIPSASCLLDPTVAVCLLTPEMARFLQAGKLFVILQATKLQAASAASVTTNSDPIQNETSGSPALKKFRFLTAKLNERCMTGHDVEVSNGKNIQEEMDRYLSEVTKFGGNNASRFWAERRMIYPALAPVAEDLLAAPASQAYVTFLYVDF